MANMSYCRFENTSHDLRDCCEALEEILNDSNAEPLSANESHAAGWLDDLCQRYLDRRAEIRRMK